MILLIRNMASDRCKTIVKEELNKLGIHFNSVELGEVEITQNISDKKLQMIDIALKKSGLEIIINNKSHIIEKIKEAVNDLVYYSENETKPNFSDFITEKVNFDYNYLSKIFSETEGITIEKYLIIQRIERAKELMVYEGLKLIDVAFKLQYSSVAHLSNQFKKVTGLSPYYYLQTRGKRYLKSRKSLKRGSLSPDSEVILS